MSTIELSCPTIDLVVLSKNGVLEQYTGGFRRERDSRIELYQRESERPGVLRYDDPGRRTLQF